MVHQALEKLKREYPAGKYDRYASIMKGAVLKALEDFCRQDEEFAQAVVQGGTFEDCMKEVAKSCGNGISDLEASRRAVRFYFPTADVCFQMRIDLAPHAHEDEAVSTAQRPVVLNLADFL